MVPPCPVRTPLSPTQNINTNTYNDGLYEFTFFLFRINFPVLKFIQNRWPSKSFESFLWCFFFFHLFSWFSLVAFAKALWHRRVYLFWSWVEFIVNTFGYLQLDHCRRVRAFVTERVIGNLLHSSLNREISPIDPNNHNAW